MKKLDEIDVQILSDLQENGRMSNVDLADRAGISAPPCLRRVRALEEAGYITGYHAELDPAAMGFTVTVFARVGLKCQAARDINEFTQMINEWPMVRECWVIAGETDFIMKIVATDWDSYQNFLTYKLSAAPNVDQVKSFMTVQKVKSLYGLPIGEEEGHPKANTNPVEKTDG